MSSAKCSSRHRLSTATGTLLIHSVAFALLVILLAPSAARAQGWTYSATLVPSPYQEITGGTVLADLSNKYSGKTTVTLPFPFEFYGKTYTQVTVLISGLLAFEPASSTYTSSHPIPDTRAPNGIVAMWWDYITTYATYAPNAEISTKVLGTAPNRVFVIQYKNIADRYAPSDVMNFQARLHEGTTVIEVHYGPRTVTSTRLNSAVGIENQNGTSGVRGLACSSSCGAAHFPIDHMIVYGTMPYLVAKQVHAPATVWSGVPSQISGEISNYGGEDAGPFDVIAVVAPSPETILGGVEIGRTRVSSGLAMGASSLVSLNAEMPVNLVSERDYWVSLIPNPDGEVEEAASGMNAAPPVMVRVGPPMPNLNVMEVMPIGNEVVLGGVQLVSYEIANRGNLEADTSYWIVLSNNDVITTQDLVLHEGLLSIGARNTVVRETSVLIPEHVNTGAYHVGVIVDPVGEVSEPDVTGNSRASIDPIGVVGEDVIVLTGSLPAGRVGRSYSMRLQAAGGSGEFRWRVASGALPAGLTLAEDGWIDGTPLASGGHNLQVLVRSGTFLAVKTYQVVVDSDSTPLTVVTGMLPGGAVGLDYSTQLFATGGETPYAWHLRPDITPPPGLRLTAEGRLLGIPTEPGSHELVVQIVDAADTVIEVELELEINMIGHLMVTTTELPSGLLDEDYSFTLEAAGGAPPYRWALDGTGRLPDGVSLASSGLIQGAPEEVGAFDIVVSVRDDRGHTNSNTFSLVVGYDQGIAITTERLPLATGGASYEASLSAYGGSAPYSWRLVSGSLPSGLALDEGQGIISGVPADDGVTRHVPFIVEVWDAAGRTALRALSISVGPAPPVMEAEGCSMAGGRSGGALLLLIAAIVGLVIRRRARSPAA